MDEQEEPWERDNRIVSERMEEASSRHWEIHTPDMNPGKAVGGGRVNVPWREITADTPAWTARLTQQEAP